ncbi:MAG: enolase C-terminal domain-like protein [Polyangiaceae bacterium]
MIHATLRRIGGLRAASAFAGLTTVGVREGVLIEASDERGRVGFGEASPLEGFHATTTDEISSRLDEITALLETTEELSLEVIRDIASRSAAPSVARFGLETALLHLLAGGGGVVPSRVAGLFGEPLETVAIAGFGGPLLGADAMGRARALEARGIRTMKFKADGADLDAERAALDAIRAGLDGDVAFRLDLNGALDPARARRALAAYASHGVELVEEPCGGADLAGLDDTAMSWFADESLADPEIASRMLEHPCCAGFVIKPALHGFFGARDLALRAIERGKQVVVTHMFDGPVALAAACELALSLPKAPLACGLDLHGGLDAYAPLVVPQHRGSVIRGVDHP